MAPVNAKVSDHGKRCGMRASGWFRSLIILLSVLPLSVVGARAQGPTAIVRLDPPNAAAAVGGIVTVNLYVQDVEELYGVDIRLSFDPALLEVQDANTGASGVQIKPLGTFLQPDFVIKAKACNVADPVDPDCSVAGTVWYAATQVNPTAPASGSGRVAAVTFKRLGAGVATLTVTHNELVDRQGMAIPSTAQNGAIILANVCYLPLILR